MTKFLAASKIQDEAKRQGRGIWSISRPKTANQRNNVTSPSTRLECRATDPRCAPTQDKPS
jgi:hypothetical protein